MKATIKDLKEFIKEPVVLTGVLAASVISAIVITEFGYMTWRRFVIPIEILLIAHCILRINRHVEQPAFERFVLTASRSLFIGGACILIAAFIDGGLFAETGYVTFAATVLLWAWIGYQITKVERRFARLSPQERKAVEESTTVLLARMADVIEKNTAAIEIYNERAPKLGLKPIHLHNSHVPNG